MGVRRMRYDQDALSWVELLERARGGCDEALGDLLDSCRQYLLLTANRLLDRDLRGKLGPSDVVQETLHEAQLGFQRFQGLNEEELLAWLRRILLNNLADAGRRYRTSGKRAVAREVSFLDEFSDGLHAFQSDSPSNQVMVQERDAVLHAALEQLREPARQVIQWRNYERCAFEEIGRRLGKSAGAARKIWVRALEQLEKSLEPLNESR